MRLSRTWYLGYDLKRTYQHNMLVSMLLVYGTVILASIVYLIVQSQLSAPTEEVLIMSGQHPVAPYDTKILGASNEPRGSGEKHIDQHQGRVVGLFSLGANLRIIPDMEPAAPISPSFRMANSKMPQPEFDQELGPDAVSEANSGTGGGIADYGLPEAPGTLDLGSPRFPDWEMQRQFNGGRTRAARVFFGGLYWPDNIPSGAICTVFVEITFHADGHLDWEIQRYGIDTAFSSFIPLFKQKLESAMRRTWFQAAQLNGVKINQVATLQAIFCPKCEERAWSERGDMEVFLKK